ncbi:MAG TPA: CDP-archaeol synthase [Vicinamibacterales bacterium]|nr:CDP-archaeol synthase [Vicinamibacterales bacterium]
MSTSLDAAACALFLLATVSLAGLCQSLWLASPASCAFAAPIDGKRRLRGRRLFGDNKTWRGVVVMAPATGAAFALGAAAIPGGAAAAGLWPLTPAQYGALGAWAGLGFMAGELPNSFLKRQLDIAPGSPPARRAWRQIGFVVDRLDSIAGLMFALLCVVSVPAMTWAYVAVIGPMVHFGFSALMFALGGKGRMA